MKTVRIIGLFFLIVIIMTLAFYCGYFWIERKNVPIEQTKSKEELISIDTIKDVQVTKKTELVYEIYNTNENTLKTEISDTMPVSYIGLNRESLVKEIERYNENPPYEELEQGFLGMELTSFSEEQIVIQKKIEIPENINKYYMVEEDGYIVVYYIDKETVYMYTDIEVKILPSDLQIEVLNGKYMKDLESLYGFLENHSS